MNTRKAVTAMLVVTLAIALPGWYIFGRTDQSKTVYADFSYVGGIYEGSKVTVLGVGVGTVTSVEPRGTSVRVAMSMPDSVDLPADASAYVLNPSVISDRHIELGPAYTGGETLKDGDQIPIERAHSPIDFDGLMGSVSTLADAFAGDGGNLGDLVSRGAAGWQGQGDQFNTAIRNLSTATGVVGARSEDIGALVDNLNTLMNALDARQVSLDELVGDLGVLGDQWASQNMDISQPLQDLRVVFDQLNSFMTAHGDDVGAIADNVRVLGDTLAAKEPGLAEFMDLVPLMMQNLSQTIGPDQRGRIRLNVSTALTQFAVAKPLCDTYKLPICTGAGFTNPISFPLSTSDPLGIASAISGGAVPGGGN